MTPHEEFVRDFSRQRFQPGDVVDVVRGGLLLYGVTIVSATQYLTNSALLGGAAPDGRIGIKYEVFRYPKDAATTGGYPVDHWVVYDWMLEFHKP